MREAAARQTNKSEQPSLQSAVIDLAEIRKKQQEAELANINPDIQASRSLTLTYTNDASIDDIVVAIAAYPGYGCPEAHWRLNCLCK